MRPGILLILSILVLLAGIGIGLYALRPAAPQAVASQIASHLEDELDALDAAAQRITAGLEAGDSTLVDSERHHFYLVHGERLLLWSDNVLVPPLRLMRETTDTRLVKVSGADYIIRRWTLSNGAYLVGQLPLARQYTIRNDYLNPEWNRRIFPRANISILEPSASIGTPVCIADNCYFRISILPDEPGANEHTRGLAIAVIAVGIGGLFFVLWRRTELVGRTRPDLAFVMLLAGTWLIRYGMTQADFPGMFIRFDLFDPQYFASSDLNRSLGDLLLNTIALFSVCYYLFRNYARFRSIRFLLSQPMLRPALALVAALLFFFSILFPSIVIQTVYNNSGIVLDIAQSLRFDALRVTAQVALILSWVCAFMVAHVCMRLLISASSRYVVAIYLIAGAVLFTIINEMSGQIYRPTLVIGVAYFLVIYLTGFYRRLRRVSYATFTYLFIVIVTLAIASTVTIHDFTRKEKIENQFRFASNYLIDRDYFAEYLLQDAARKIASDAFIQSRIASPFLGKEAIRQKVRQVFLPSYFNKYDVEILLFGPGGTPINNRTQVTFQELLSAYDADGTSPREGVYYASNPASDITQRYLVVSEIVRSGVPAGYVVLELLLKKIIPENVYPELLIDNRFQQYYRVHDISYAVYGRGLLYSSGTFNYERMFRREYLGDPDIHLRGIVLGDYVHVAVEDGNNRVAVVSSPVAPPQFILANFSFLLVLGLSVLLVFVLIQGLITLIGGSTLFFSARIQLMLNLAFFIPLFVVSATTLRLTSQASQEQLNSEYLGKSRSFGTQLEVMLTQYTDPEERDALNFENQLADLARMFNLDANVYDPEGHLLASSQPAIFTNGLASPYSDEEAVRRIRQGENQMIITERVGSLQYNVSYVSLKSPVTGTLIGILGVPFFQSQASLEKIQIRALANILNVFAVMFIVLLVLSYVVSEWLTFPLHFITRSLSRTSLTKTNQPLTWDARDEIGLMVREYNNMVYKLEESKAELERSQRERAWREIAQQVAHEIKNPLTPMKLTLQQLERQLKNGGDVRDKIPKALDSLMAQVDTLNEIASSFSTFAKMPVPDIQRVELVGLLKRIVDLHGQSGAITFRHSQGEVEVLGDPQLLGRIFSNIILNAFQAERPGTPIRVDISLERVGDNWRISFQDNGKGIEPEVADRVFVPHFSTKRSGSGLGMAISRQGIEQMNGSIYFTSKPGEGTTFFVELPAIRP
nr:MAG: hypothetical protein DIU61_00360 [Bacteroidota bacterium]